MSFKLPRRGFLAGSVGLLATPFLAGRARAAGSVVAATFPGTWEDAYRSVVAPIEPRPASTSPIAPALAQDQIGKMMASAGDAALRRAAGVTRADRHPERGGPDRGDRPH